jgi:SAM-dependent methyltransferase
MSFDVPPDAYSRFMGRFAEPLADQFVDLLEPAAGQRGLDVGCGTGILTQRLVARLGAGSVAAIDPSERFVESTRTTFAEVDVRQGTAEDLPWADATFDAVGAQLVVHFMTDPVRGLGEMLRVTRPGGRVGACVWDHAGDGTPLAVFWRGAHEVDPDARDESGLAGSWEGHLAELLTAAGAHDVASGSLDVAVDYRSFEQWWEPYTQGVGPAGAYVAGLSPEHRAAVEDRCRALLPDGSFTIRASAWYAVATPR